MKKLIVGNTYVLKNTGEFCHCVGKKGFVDFSKNMNDEDRIKAVFVGQVETGFGPRNIFYDKKSNTRSYIMFSSHTLDYIEADGKQ